MIIRILKISGLILLILAIFYGVLSIRPKPETITYGMSFNTLYARELGLDWRETYDAILSDLAVRHLRLAAHWTMIEPQDGVFNWEELDYQVEQAKKYDAEVILAIGRRLPRWPECHIPDWAGNLSWEEQKVEILEQIEEVVLRYKDESHITHWQVENEPYLTVFAKEHCGEFDEGFLKEEIELVKSLDPDRPVLVTDSGNLGLWYKPYSLGDSFGTSVYLFFWNPEVGPFKSILPPSYYRVKQNIMWLLVGKKETFLIELSAEPWLLGPVVEASKEIQLERMSIEKFNKILKYAEKTRFEQQYLWGAEWWYWLKQKGYSEFWERGQELF